MGNNESTEILYENLNGSDKNKVDQVYQAYHTASNGIWHREEFDPEKFRKLTPEELEKLRKERGLDPSVQEIFNKDKINTANGWANFTFGKIEKNPIAHEDAKKLFEAYYLPASQGKNYSGNFIPKFNDFFKIQKDSWLAAAKEAYKLQLNKDSENNQESELDNQFASRPSMSR